MTVTERNIKRNVTPSPFRERGLLTCRAKKEEERTRIRSPFMRTFQDQAILQTLSRLLFDNHSNTLHPKRMTNASHS